MKAVADRKDITLAELQERLARRGARFGIGTLWRFFDRHGITVKKRQRMPPSSNAPML
jgi:transposase